MVLNVEIHVPIEKLHNRIQDDRARAEAKVRYIVLQADMLRVVAEEKQPTTIKGGYSNQHRQQPEAKIERNGHQQKVPNEQGARPGKEPLLFGRVVSGKEDLLPTWLQPPLAEADDAFPAVDQSPWVDQGTFVETCRRNLNRQDHL